MSIEQSTQFTKIISSRKVCVVNMHDQDYIEEYKGEKIEIPANGKRSVYMPLWKARKFLASCSAPPAYDITGEVIRGGKVKMLRISELEETEQEKLGELTPEEALKKQSIEDEKQKLRCGMCGLTAKSDAGLKAHVTKMHPEATQIE